MNDYTSFENGTMKYFDENQATQNESQNEGFQDQSSAFAAS